MRKFGSVALVAAAILLAMAGPSHAVEMSGHGGPGGQHGSDGHHESDGHQGGEHGNHDGDRDGHRGRHPFVGGGPVFYWNYPYYAYSPLGYWYYCPSAEAYYPYVANCLDAWVPVPAR